MKKNGKIKELRTRIDAETYAKLHKKAEENGLTVISYVRMVLMLMVK